MGQLPWPGAGACLVRVMGNPPVMLGLGGLARHLPCGSSGGAGHGPPVLKAPSAIAAGYRQWILRTAQHTPQGCALGCYPEHRPSRDLKQPQQQRQRQRPQRWQQAALTLTQPQKMEGLISMCPCRLKAAARWAVHPATACTHLARGGIAVRGARSQIAPATMAQAYAEVAVLARKGCDFILVPRQR